MFEDVLEVPKPLLIFLNSCSSFYSGWMFLSSFWSIPLIWVPVSFSSLLVPYTFSFVTLSIAFIFSSNLQPNSTNSVSILITSVLNCAFGRLAIPSLLSCIFSGALIYSFIWAIFFFFFFLVLACLLCKGAELRCLPRRGNPPRSTVMLYVGEGSKREQ